MRCLVQRGTDRTGRAYKRRRRTRGVASRLGRLTELSRSKLARRRVSPPVSGGLTAPVCATALRFRCIVDSMAVYRSTDAFPPNSRWWT